MCLRLHCLFTAVCVVISNAQLTEDIITDFVDASTPPNPITWRTRINIKSVCTTDKLVGITLFLSTDTDKGQFGRTFQKFWRCRGNPDAVQLQIRRARIPLADDVAFRPSLFNAKSTVVEAAKLFVWMVDDIVWWKMEDAERRQIHKWALSRKSFDVHLLPPYSRPYKTFRRSCVPWFVPLLQVPRLSDRDVCPVEQVVVPLLSFPAVFNGQTYGVIRTIASFRDPFLEQGRLDLLLTPRFSLEVWVFVEEYCPLAHLNAARACMLVGHLSSTDQHLTPCVLLDDNGLIQVEATGPGMYVAHRTMFPVPKRQWVQILLTFHHRMWTVTLRYGKSFNETIHIEDRFQGDVFFNDTEGIFLLGGNDGKTGSFHGYLGQVKLYRGRIMTLEQLKIPDASDPMFRLVSVDAEDSCGQFLVWFHRLLDLYVHKAVIRRNKRFCPNSYRWRLTREITDTRLQSCPPRLGVVSQDRKRVARLLRSAAIADGHVTSEEEAAIARKLLDCVTASAEEHGLRDLHETVGILEQAVCLGSKEASFTLAAFLNNGVGTTLQEDRSAKLLMKAAAKRHRLSTLALGHRHALGLDDFPVDRDVAYMYFKDIGDKTKDDRETHPEDQVATETIRLMDEQTLGQQTDESGDIFMWLKHQAQQGVTSAQSHLAHLYFWGSQGMRRNLQAARHLFQQGAAQGDTDSIYNLAIMDLLGKGGVTVNETSGKENLQKAAQKKHPYAISALGWIALEKERNYTKAASHFDRAYKLNFMDAGYYLGHMYQNGLYPNKTRDVDTALRYYEWAARRGHVIAGMLFTHLMSRGTPKRPRDPQFAMEWARYIAEQNGVVGTLLRKGVQAYKEGNIGLAAFYYLLASETGVEVASFNMAWLCEEFKETVTANIKKECQWRHYNLTVQREDQFVDPYSYIKMGDYFWYGCQGQRNMTQAAKFYAAAARKKEPHALFNLAFMVEEGAKVPESVWNSLHISQKHYSNNVTLLLELYERCRESKKSEAFIPCSLALYRVWLLDLWDQYQLYLKTSTFLGGVMALVGTAYFMVQCVSRWRNNAVQLYQL